MSRHDSDSESGETGNDGRREMTPQLCFRIAATPTDYSEMKLNRLFEKGYEPYHEYETTDQQRQKFIDDIEDFGLTALQDRSREQAKEEAIIGRPAQLATLAALSGLCVMHSDRFRDSRPKQVQPWVHIRELYTVTMERLVTDHADLPILQDIAEVLYRKPYGTEVKPYPGRVITDIVARPEWEGDSELYLEVPVVAASPKCLVYEDESEQDDLRTKVKDNNLYIPADVFNKHFRRYLREKGFPSLYKAKRNQLSDEELAWMVSEESAITDEIDGYYETNNYDRLWTNWNGNKRLLSVLERAVREAPDMVLCLGESATAKQLFTVVSEYDPESRWQQSVCDDITDPSYIANELSEMEDSPQVEVETDTSQDQNLYTIYPARGESRGLAVSSPEDLLELPCYQNLDERLQEEGPSRKELYDLVRKLAWLPEYRITGDPDTDYEGEVPGRPDEEKIVEDVKEFFSRWPWYDEAVTEYQTRYEIRQDEERRRDPDRVEPLPMGCDNPTMQRYCVGKEACPYSIYSSLPFSQAMFDRLEELQSLEEGVDAI